MLELLEVCRLPRRPSDVLGMRAAGYTPHARLAVDLAYVGVDREWTRLRDATKEVNAPERDKNAKPKARVPAHSEAELLAWLGVSPEEPGAGARSLLPGAEPEPFDPALLDGLDWGDEPEGGG